jgi:hypothetical protein
MQNFCKHLVAMSLVVIAPASAAALGAPSFGSSVVNSNISEKEVQAAQEGWGAALIKISEEFDSKGLAVATVVAASTLDGAYGYNLGPVLFKPTLASGDRTFRTTREGALAYFVGSNKNFPDDKGFALKSWRKFAYTNASVQIHGDIALTMGTVVLTDKNGNPTRVDKTWGFRKDDKGVVRIILHHSSLPYGG